MKRLLSFLAIALLTLSAMGKTVTFTPRTVHLETTDPDLSTLTYEGIKIHCTAGTFTRTDHYRFNAFSTTTITSTIGHITKVEFTCTGQVGQSHAPDLFSGEGYTASGYKGTWTGVSDTISLYASAQVRATQIVVTVEDSPTGLVPPVFYPNGGEFDGTLEVTLNCPTQGAEIHYIEGSTEEDFDWSTEATYEGPFVLTRSTTLTAWSTLGDERSENVTAVFTRRIPTVAAPEFTPGSTIFTDSVVVTIECPDSTATIYYSYDEENWEPYVGTITVKTDVMIFAKAVIEDDEYGSVESETVLATYTLIGDGEGYEIIIWNTDVDVVDEPYTITRPGVSIMVTRGLSAGLRIYKNEHMIFTATKGNITKIKMSCGRFGYKYGPSGFTLDEGQDGEYTYQQGGPTGIWLGNSPVVALTASNDQVRCNSIIVYVDTEPTSEQVAAPEFEPNVLDTVYVYSQQVTLSCATPGATIYYGFNTDFDTWTQYTEPFTVTDSCMVYALAELNGVRSSVSFCNYNKAIEVDNIAAMNNLYDNKRFAFNGNVIVTYQKDERTWIKDDTGYGLIYSEDVPRLPQGSILQPGWDGLTATYNKVPEAIDPHNIVSDGRIVVVTPTEHTTVTLDNVNEYVIFKDQTLTQSAYDSSGRTWLNANGLIFFNQFQIPMNVEDGQTYDITGMVSNYGKNLEVFIISVIPSTGDTEWASGDVNHDGKVDVTDVTLLISYLLDGTNSTIYLSEANVDGDTDGNINITDATMLISRVLNSQ